MTSIKSQSNFTEIVLRHGCSPVNVLYICSEHLFPRTSLEGCFCNISLEQELFTEWTLNFPYRDSNCYFEALPSFKSERQYESDETNLLTLKQTHHPKHEQIQNENKTSKHQSLSVNSQPHTLYVRNLFD